MPFEFTFSRITDDDGEVTHVAGVGRDVRERAAREQAVATLHETTRALITAETPRDVFEHAVAAADSLLGLSRTAFYRWDGDERALVAAAGDGALDDLPVLGDDSPVWAAFVAEETHTVAAADVFDGLETLVMSVGSHGVLVAGSEADGFNDVDVTVLEVLAATVASAVNAVERKEALVTGGDVEVAFRVPDATGPVSAMARRTGATFDLEEVVSKDDGSWLVYVAAADIDPASVSAAADALVSVESADVFDADSECALGGLVVSEFPAVDVLAAHGASVQSLAATPQELEVSVTVPRTRSVRALVAACEERLPGIELVRRSQRASQPAVLVESLTEKQRTALKTAYEHGFFSWPREHTGEEVASAMGVSAPTFHQHLRKALGTVFAEAFGEHAGLND
ncbi:bacterio-opsin activator domain-containing protein [Salarchaeum sp. JOR-1]|uniref:bacterio-opsin activator domain-containing protein n=1 Tax=Salarchaeum sp. JOR-1 TaxID=2599399 RepID=UPI0011986E88|nr:bacterio-opsin activator domain-containing protein [Salarchaeum sp. JOR-1]QDX40788.1 hypothetical protein FQU85_07660 [Salarchaeum sp. JOR-1]